MRFIQCKDYEELSLTAAKLVREQILGNPHSKLGLATGSTPVGAYRHLVRMHKEEGLDFSGVSSYNLDEYYPLSPEDPQSYRYFMNQNLFDHVNIDKAKTHVPCGMAEDPAEECKRYDAMLSAAGHVDLQILGIGENGHIGFNEPADSLHANTHLIHLSEDTIAVNARFFAKIEDVPTKALTMGIGSIMCARKILLLISGPKKHKVLHALFDDSITTSIPATLLKAHPDVVVIYDQAAFEG